jgi:alkyl sulfatase BDS1-like metallo-beta-lactamase superfamily hydrolase
VFEQLGYQSESGAWRNFYLVGAQELRHGFPGGRSFSNASPDLIAGMTTAMLLDYLAIRLNGPRAAAVALRIGLEVTAPDAATERLLLIVQNGVLRFTPSGDATPASTLRITHADLADLAYGVTTLDELLTKGKVEIDGDRSDLDGFLGLLDTFTAGFDVVTPNLR